MEITFDIINGLCFGIEYVPADADEGLPNPCVIMEFACFRWILEIM